MDSLDAITLKSFLAALMRLDNSLPVDLQNQLNKIGKTFPTDISKLDTLAESYAPLEQEYKDARLALQKDGERFRFVVPEPDNSTEISEEKLINFAVEVLNANDSVDLVQRTYADSNALGQLLFHLRKETSFMVKNAQNIPEEELWLWQNPTAWASLESGLRQTQAGEIHYLGSFAQYADSEIDD